MSRFVLTAQLQLQAPTNTAQIVRQIQSQLNNVQVNVQVQGTAQATRQVQQVAQSLNAANSAASNLGRTFAISVKRFTALAVATRAVSLFTNTLANATQEAIDFERQLIKVSQVTGQSIGELKGLTKTITTLATGLGVGSKSLLEVSTILLQAGLNANDTEVALKSLAKAALAPNFDSITETAEGAIAILAQFQKGVGALEGQLSSINAVAGAFAVEAGDLIDVIRRTGGVFKASGGSLNELLALFTSVRATTRESAESIGTGLRTIFTRIQRPKTIEFLKQFGVELVDLEGKFVGPFEAVRRLSQALAGLGEGDITFIRIAEELGGFRQIGKVLPLLQQFSTAQAALSVAQKANNGLTKDAETAQQALAIRIVKVKEEFLALVRSITETSSFQFFANTTLNLASALIRLADALKPIIPLLTAVATIKLAQGLSGFIGGFGRGIGSGRTFNEGGKVLKFARGGMVPGSGNRDTVPAMLQPGEFVIRKSSVNKLGAGNLAAMNSNKYASGGLVIKDLDSEQFAGLFARPRGADQSGKPISIALNTISGGKELLAAVGKPKSYFIGNTDESSFIDEAQNTLINSINSLSSRLGGPEVPTGQIRKTLTDSIGIEDIAGKMFEGVTRTVVGYFGGNSRGVWDIPSGSVNNTGAFNQLFNNGQPLPNINYDAKLSENRSNRASLLNKAIASNISSNEISLASFQRKQTTDELIKLQKGSRGKFTDALVKRREELETAKNNAARYIDDEATLDIILKRILRQSQSISAALPASAAVSSRKKINKNLGGLIQKFAKGSSGKGVQSTKKIGKKRGFFFDFDDTLATTGAIERPGTADPYSDFRGEKGRKLLESAAATRYAAMAKRRASEGHDVWVLTARPGDKDTVSGIKTFGAKNGLMFKGVIGVGGSAGKKGVDTATAKSMILSRYAKNYPDGIIFADDLRENILAAQQQMQRSGVPFKSVVAKKYFGGLIQKFASGGGVGTDTVPALLTPGEFVINKKSAQSIGYGSLNRMNKVGKYANGGIVGIQKFAKGGQPDQMLAQAMPIINANTTKFAAATLKLEKALGILTFGLTDLYGNAQTLKLKTESNTAIMKMLSTSGQELISALEANNQANKRSIKNQDNMSRAIELRVADLINSSVSQKEIEQKVKKYIQALDKDTKAKQQSAASTAKSSSTPSIPSSGGGKGIQPTKSITPPIGGASKTSQGNNNIFTGLGSQLTLVTASLQALIPPIDENSSGFAKLTNNLLSFTTTIGAAIFALEAFNIKITKDVIAKGLKSLTTTGKGGLGDIIGGFQRQGGKTVRSPNETFTKQFEVRGKIQELRQRQQNLDFSPSGKKQRAALGSRIQNLTRSINTPESLTGKLGSILGKKAAGGGIAGRAAGLAGRAISGIGGLGGGAVGGALGTAAAFAGPAVAITGVVAAIDGLVGSFRDLDGQLKESIKVENFAKAQSLAVSKSNSESIPIIGNLVGGFFDLIGAQDSLANFFSYFGGQSADQIKTGIATQIQANKAQKALAKASEDSAKALQDFQNGTIGAIDVLKSTAGATRESGELRKRTQEQVAANEGSKNSLGFAIARNVGAYLGGGLFGMDTNETRNKKIDEQNKPLTETAKKAEEDAFKAAQPGLQVLQRQVAATGGSFQDFIARVKEADPALADYIGRQGAGTLGLTDSFENLRKEAERTKAAFNAMNLGFQKVSAVSGALSVGLENYLASQEAGNIGIENNIRTLEASITNAAQGISNSDFTAALGGASNGLRQLGASEAQIKKFEQNLGAINTAQKFFAQASQEVKNTLAANFAAGRGANMGAVEQRELFASTLVNQLDGVDETTKKRISDAIAGAEISTDDLNKIAQGDLSVLDKVLKDLGETTLNQVIGPLKEYGKYQKTLVDLTKKRIELENNLISAQRGVLDAQLEAQEIISKYGGPALTPQIRTQNAIAQANIQTQGTRVSALRTGSAAELNQRNRETRQRLIEIGNVRTRAAAGNVAAQQQLQGRGGAELEAEQKRLQELAKSDYETTKLLIKNKEEELKLLQEKNKLEKDSIDALISGDMEKFFEQQAAAGAQAAIALGSDRLQGAFGASALGAAAQDIRRQQEAGQQTLFGQQLAGPGGLTERAFGAAVGARGITDPRLAQIAAGTTAEESGVEAQIRELAATLPNYAQTQLESSQQELYAAQWQVQAAEMQLKAARANVEDRSGGVPIAAGKAKGGVVYANRGIFVPRGTDTVPAMLTPGEFVVRREAVQRGNNLQLLQSMNRGQSQGSASTAIGMARGGVVNQTQYLAFGGFAKAVSGLLDGDFVGKLTQSFNTFISEMSRNIDKLNSTNFTMKLDTTNVNVNLTGGSFLNKMKDELREELMKEVANKIQNYKAGEGGNLKENSTVLGR